MSQYILIKARCNLAPIFHFLLYSLGQATKYCTLIDDHFDFTNNMGRLRYVFILLARLADLATSTHTSGPLALISPVDTSHHLAAPETASEEKNLNGDFSRWLTPCVTIKSPGYKGPCWRDDTTIELRAGPAVNKTILVPHCGQGSSKLEIFSRVCSLDNGTVIQETPSLSPRHQEPVSCCEMFSSTIAYMCTSCDIMIYYRDRSKRSDNFDLLPETAITTMIKSGHGWDNPDIELDCSTPHKLEQELTCSFTNSSASLVATYHFFNRATAMSHEKISGRLEVALDESVRVDFKALDTKIHGQKHQDIPPGRGPKAMPVDCHWKSNELLCGDFKGSFQGDVRYSRHLPLGFEFPFRLGIEPTPGTRAFFRSEGYGGGMVWRTSLPVDAATPSFPPVVPVSVNNWNISNQPMNLSQPHHLNITQEAPSASSPGRSSFHDITSMVDFNKVLNSILQIIGASNQTKRQLMTWDEEYKLMYNALNGSMPEDKVETRYRYDELFGYIDWQVSEGNKKMQAYVGRDLKLSEVHRLVAYMIVQWNREQAP